MGTAISIEIVDGPEHVDQLIASAFAWFREADARFSTYKADSEVSRLDRGELRIDDSSADLRTVLHACADCGRTPTATSTRTRDATLDPSGLRQGLVGRGGLGAAGGRRRR